MQPITDTASRRAELSPHQLESTSAGQRTSLQQSHCETCDGSGWLTIDGRAKPCACQRENAIRRELPPRYHNAAIRQFSPAVQRLVLRWLEDPGDGLLLSGNVGSGKTHLAAAIVRDRLEHGRDCAFRRLAKVYADLRETFRTNASEADVLKPCLERPMLVLDDLGAGALSDFERRGALEILDVRLNTLRPTIVTTNLELEEIAIKLDDRIASRLASYEHLRLTGEDHRLER